jgi:hypothetical protein
MRCEKSEIEFDEILDVLRKNWLQHWARRGQPFDEHWNLTLDSRPTNDEKFMDFRLLRRNNGGFVAIDSFAGAQVIV